MLSVSWHAGELHINEIIQYTVFCVSCFLLTKISMTLIHAIACISYLILCSCPLYEQISTDTSLILSMGIWVVASLEAIMKNATMYILALISRWTHVLTSLEYISGGLNAESQWLKETAEWFFQSVCAILYSYQQGLSLSLLNYRFQFSVEIFRLFIHLIHLFFQNI